MARGPASYNVMPGKTARALCPVCQEPMPPDETECANCGAFVIDEAVVRLSRAFGIDREKALALFEKGFRHPKQLQDRDLDSVLERNEDGLLYLCTNCGGFVATGDASCARCGAEFETGPQEAASPERDILDLVLCPVCGADNESDRLECEICSESLRPEDVPLAAAAPSRASVAADPQEGVPCPTCGTEKAGILAPCPVCDRPKDESKLAKVDAFLDDLDTPEGRPAVPEPSEPRPPVRPIPRVSKVSRLPTVVRAATRTQGLSAPPPPAREAASVAVELPPPAPQSGPERDLPRRSDVEASGRPPAAEARPRPLPERTLRGLWAGPPPEFSGAVAAASGIGLLLASSLGETGVLWGLAFVLAALCVYLLATLPLRDTRIDRIDAILLTLGAVPGLLAPAAPGGIAPLVAVAGAFPLAWATRRLLTSPTRALLIVASAVPLIALAAVAASGLPFASTEAWSLAVLAAIPWPAILAARELAGRRFGVALRHELSRAERNLSRRDYAESLRDYDRAIELSRKSTVREALPWYGKGATLILLGRYEEALRAIDTALDINPRNEVAWLNKGNALMKLGRHLDALRCFNAALKVNPRYEVALNNKGNALARLGHFEEALRCYEKAIAIDRGYRGAWINKGYVLTKLGRYEEAASCADRALHLDGEPPAEAA